MQCTLYIPHLILPRETGAALWRAVAAPPLKQMLDRASFTGEKPSGSDALLCGLFGVAQQHDWPLAPVLARGDGLAVESGYWLCATPVHLETRRKALVLSGPDTLAVTQNESIAFTGMLAAHLREEHITLHAPQPTQWYLHCETPPALTTTSLDTAEGRDVRTFLPQGADSARWHRILTEMQMLLHAHPANEAREARGLRPVNSVWLWGGGTLPPAVTPARFGRVGSNDATVQALAQHAGCPVTAAPLRIAADILMPHENSTHFFSLESLTACLRSGDGQAWQNAVTALDRDWFAPLWEMLKSRRLSALTLISSNDDGTQRFVIRPTDHYKFWRKNKYLSYLP